MFVLRGTLIGEVITDVKIVVSTGLLTTEGIAVDWINKNLYWIDSKLDAIEVVKIDGSDRKSLITGDMGNPRSLALDPTVGYMFWTDWDSDVPRIERATMTGEDRIVLKLIDYLHGAWPNGITLDYVVKRIYWTDAKSHSIHTVLYDGTDHRVVVQSEAFISHPFGIALFENNVYWTDWRLELVFRANKWNGSDITRLHITNGQPYGIHIMHSSRQIDSDYKPCNINNGGCSHLCLMRYLKHIYLVI